jgi:hemoglobin
MSEHPTLHEWAGGDAAFRRLIDSFYDRVERDELLSRYFPGGVSEDHRAHVTQWWSEVFGGAPVYTDTLGGYEAMLAHDRGLAITPEDRLRFATLLSLAADDASLPDDPEFRAALMGYVEWGTRLALHNSEPGAAVADHAPVPRWGWGVAPPYQPHAEGDQQPSEIRPTLARILRGRVPAERADEYESYYMEAGIEPLKEAVLGVQALREDRGDEIEFVTISYWEEVAAMSRFAGDDPLRIHHLDRDAEFLVELSPAWQF